MEIQARDTETYENVYKGIAFIWPGAFGARRTRKSYFLQKFWKIPVTHEFTGFAVKSVDFIEMNGQKSMNLLLYAKQ